jgi:ATP-dependent exoDNAse (exonuclease V) beta subunit
MFNQLTPAYVVASIGKLLRAAARADGTGSEFERDQLMSAYSASRHLAVELASYDAEMRKFTETLQAIAPPSFADRIGADPDPRDVGTVVSELLESLRADASPDAARLRGEVHALLRELSDREVELLAEGLA